MGYDVSAGIIAEGLFCDGMTRMGWLGNVWGDEGDGVAVSSCCRSGKPGTGAEPGSHVGNGARGCGALAEATEEFSKAVPVLGGSIDREVGEGLSNPFKEAMGGEANEVEGEHLGFGGDTIKVFLFVLIDVSKIASVVINDVFDC